ncbi:MAG: hypothetical protein A2X08_03345 [Bacteroidetes bacterium GWA2_32_17]|nr:MAG: hypothetical protein A2X08_03345 [Bacteroidetes bacterium GWA2_32_17]
MKTKQNIFIIICATAVYFLLILHHGYELGRNDHEQAAYGYFLNDNSLYAYDFYMQSLVQQTPNERTFYGKFISFTGNNIPLFSFIWHFVFTIILLLGVRKISTLFIKNEWFRWLSVTTLFLVLYNIHLGSNELYYNSFIPSLPAKAIGVWGLWFFTQKKYLYASLLYALSIYFQPLAGGQLVVISFILLLITSIKTDKLKFFKNALWLVIPVSFITLPFLISAFLKFNNSNVPDCFIFDVFFSFRNPHHFLPSYFSLKNYFVLIPIFIFSLIYYKKHSAEIFYFILTVIFGCFVYAFFVEYYHYEKAASTQWFKSTIWVEMFGAIALIGMLEQIVNNIIDKYFLQKKTFMLFVFISTAFVLQILFPFNLPWKVKYDFNSFAKPDNAVKISLMAKEKTPVNACFVTPIDFTELKFYGQRSSYIDYKLPVHNKLKIVEWMQRVARVYKVDYRNKEKGFEVNKVANNNFYNLNERDLKVLKHFGVSYIITNISHKLAFKVIAKNKEFVIYQIDSYN